LLAVASQSLAILPDWVRRSQPTRLSVPTSTYHLVACLVGTGIAVLVDQTTDGSIRFVTTPATCPRRHGDQPFFVTMAQEWRNGPRRLREHDDDDDDDDVFNHCWWEDNRRTTRAFRLYDDELLFPTGCNSHLTLVEVSHIVSSTNRPLHLSPCADCIIDVRKGLNYIFILVAFSSALRGMPAMRKVFVCLFICQTRALWQNGRKICPDFISYERSFSLVFWEEEWLVKGQPFYQSTGPRYSEMPILNRYSLVAPQPQHLAKKFN